MDVQTATLSDRKDRLLAKLEQRHEERKNANDETHHAESAKIDQLMRDIKNELENKITDSLKIERLQEYQAFSVSNRQSKAIQNLLEDVRKFKLTKKSTTKFTGFSFSKAVESKPKKEARETFVTPVSIVNPSVSSSSVSDIKNENQTISGTNGDEISLKNIESCRLQFTFEPSVVHMRNVKNSTLLFLRCDRSVLMHDCLNLTIFVAAQQIRIHTSESIRLHVATRGAVILEDSTGISMFPYRLKNSEGKYLQAEDNGEWRTPRDFNWLSTTPSPNWRLVPEEAWTDEQLN